MEDVLLLLSGVFLGGVGCSSSDKVSVSDYPSAHDVARLIEDDGLVISYYSGLESTYYDATENGWTNGLGFNDDSPLTGIYEPTWVADSPVADVVPISAPSMLDSKTMYYCKADWSADDGSACIGRATGTGSGAMDITWEDEGEPVLCSTSEDVALGAPFAIDPAVFLDDDRLWMTYGSHYSGIWLVELDAETGMLPDGVEWSTNSTEFVRLANYPAGATENYVEAPFVYRHEDWYYLFVNWDQCCMGTDSTYNIRVGRSQSVTGPYLDIDGVDMIEGGGTLVLESEGRFVGPGHAGITDLEDHGLLFSFHFYDTEKDGEGSLGTRSINFVDGWPIIGEDGTGIQ